MKKEIVCSATGQPEMAVTDVALNGGDGSYTAWSKLTFDRATNKFVARVWNGNSGPGDNTVVREFTVSQALSMCRDAAARAAVLIASASETMTAREIAAVWTEMTCARIRTSHLISDVANRPRVVANSADLARAMMKRGRLARDAATANFGDAAQRWLK